MKGIQDFVCLDLETTGLNPKSDRIIEIGMVKVRRGKIVATFSSLLDPRQKLEERVQEITGIKEEELKGKPQLKEMLPQIMDFLEEDILLGHSILFDYSFLKRACTNEKIPFERKAIDTLKIARRVVTDCESKSLESLCGYYGMEYRAHRALEDAYATVGLYNILCDRYYQEEIFAPRQLYFKVKKESPINRTQREQLTALCEKHNLKLPAEIDSLTRNEASRQIDRILSIYGR